VLVSQAIGRLNAGGFPSAVHIAATSRIGTLARPPSVTTRRVGTRKFEGDRHAVRRQTVQKALQCLLGEYV